MRKLSMMLQGSLTKTALAYRASRLRLLRPCGRLVLGLLFALLWVSSAQGQTPEQIQNLGNVTIRTVDGATVVGAINRIERDGKVIGEGIPPGTLLGQILSIESERDAVQKVEQDIEVHLAGGGKVFASAVVIDGESVSLQSSSGIQQLNLESIQGVVWHGSSRTKDLLKNLVSGNDRVVVSTENGQRVVEGVLEGVDSQKVRLNIGGKSRSMSFSKVKIESVVVADLALSPPRGTRVTVALADGSSVQGGFQSLASGVLRLELSGGHAVALAGKDVIGMTVRSGRLAYLSALEPITVEQSVQFTVKRSWKRNRSVEGNPLRINGAETKPLKTYSNGLGTQATTRLVFANDGFDQFRATVGIDAETKGRGDCVMRVIGDGITLWEKRVRADDAAQDVAVEITGLKQVELMVLPGEQFDLADHANWCEARFIKQNRR